ncbi:MAG: recombinase family protein [Verrucomicrobia bacterium]|nr:recombinase family protein [Verrucomicrobiota bacterium]
MKADNSPQRVPTPKNVGIWIRVSTEDQARGESPQHHEARAREYAKWNKWEVREVYDLSGVSGKTVMEHPEGKRMQADVKRGHITGLIFSKLARLARNTRELLDFSDFFRQHNADMISLQEKIDTSTPAGRLFYTMIAGLAQWEREEIADRVKASIRIRAKLGKSLGGAAPFGYEWKDKRLVPSPAEAPVRRLMYELFAKHKRRKSVARMLNESGYRTRNGSKFTDTTVVRLLQDPTAKGFYRANHTYRDGHGKLILKPESEWVHTPVEPIIPEALWNECNEALAKRKERKLGPKPVHLFAGILRCGCGQRMYVYSRSPKYICPNCRSKIPMETIEEVFREELQDFFVSKEKLDAHLAQANEHVAGKKAQLEAHTRRLDKVRSEMRKVYDLYQADEISPDGFGKLYRPLEDQERALANELPKLQGEVDALEMRHLSASEVVAEATDLYRSWPRLAAEQKRGIIESIVDKIVLTGDEIDITFAYMPTSEEFTKRQRNLSGSLPRSA